MNQKQNNHKINRLGRNTDKIAWLHKKDSKCKAFGTGQFNHAFKTS